MKHKNIIALALASTLSVSAPAVTAFAETPAADSISQATEQDIQTSDQEGQVTDQESQATDQESQATDQESQATDQKKEKKQKKQRPDQSDGETANDGSDTTSGKHAKKEKVEEPEGSIGKDAAKEKALADAGVTAEQVDKVRSRVSAMEDGTVYYKVRFIYNGLKYSYQVDAATGSIVGKSTEEATEEETGSHGHGKQGMKKDENATVSEAETPSEAI